MTKGSLGYVLGVVAGLALIAADTSFALAPRFGEHVAFPTRLIEPRHHMGLVELDRIIQPITTITQFSDGKRELNIGNGFIVGGHYFTVYHNLTSFTTSLSARKTIYLDGTPLLTPTYAHSEKDVAIFDLPDDLCAKHCNDITFGTMPDLERDRKVYWLRKFKGEMSWKGGRVLNYAFIGEVPMISDEVGAGRCRANLIVEVDTPFLAGSSGAPVLDAATGQIIGIIQGNMESRGVRSGYFKPINCVTPFVDQ